MIAAYLIVYLNDLLQKVAVFKAFDTCDRTTLILSHEITEILLESASLFESHYKLDKTSILMYVQTMHETYEGHLKARAFWLHKIN